MLLRISSVILLAAIWEAAGRGEWVDPRFLSYPSAILVAGVDLMSSGELWPHALTSLQELLFGFLAALVVGILLGILMGWSKVINELFDPVLTSLYCLPRTSLMPLIVIWLGVGLSSKAAIVFLGAIFPILVNTIAGIRSADPIWVRAAVVFGARQWEIFHKILLPSSLPYIMAGVRLGLGRAILGVIVGEMYVATRGIGHQIMLYQVGLNVDYLFFLVLLTAFTGVLLVNAARRLEARLGRWQEESRS